MAEIHVQTKKHQASNSWIWIVIALLVVAGIAYYFLRNSDNTNQNNVPANTGASTSFHTSVQALNYYQV